ncbi:hypothetical protein [Saccharothrix yanglingensis]|uniref:Uncharacterized protein n=1 Tax=Saccharothrix yanglingensis TaxID=659496 RepID=A0ABU0WSD7_9PSEU|nr:hypothetical protein [Saccharothrix yanglingensis]MDQ2582750.1 hypothetical protein [Saccharothrix yanglingensis]
MTTDRALLDALAHLVDRLDPTPEVLAHRARTALAERTDATPMRLLTDSAHTTPPGVRGRGSSRTLRFAGLDLQLDHVDNGLHATGLISPTTLPALTGLVLVCRPGGETRARIDTDGWFHVDHVPFGPVRFVLHAPARDLATPWFTA